MNSPPISIKDAEDMAYGWDGEPTPFDFDPGVRVVARQRGEDHRWESEWMLVVSYDGKLWGADYRLPLTETADAGYGPFEGGLDWYRVAGREISVTVYERASR